MIRSLSLAMLLSTLVLAVGCGSTTAEKAPAPGSKAEAREQDDGAAIGDAKRQPPAAERDERQKDGNFLELLERKQEELESLRRKIGELESTLKEAQTTASSAKEGETRALGEAERLQGLLQDAVARERAAEDRFFRARLDAVRAEKELYRQKIAALGQSEEK